MRLYSRNQVTGIVVAAVIVTASGAFLLDRVARGSASSPSEPAAIAEIREPAETSGIELKTNVPSVTIADAAAYTQDEAQNITVYERANEAVVNITTETVGINWFLEPVPQEGGSGSGSIIDTRGYVVTNSHVISDAVKIYVSLSDGTQFEGKVVCVDRENDIAVLKFTPPAGVTLKNISFGNS